ncbi:hypothetical protein ACERII_04620 [Evansella sp. AB-rgal1]
MVTSDFTNSVLSIVYLKKLANIGFAYIGVIVIIMLLMSNWYRLH